MRERGADRLVPVPTSGRVFAGETRVRFGDVSPSGQARLDAVARYLQDVSNDDNVDAGLGDDAGWVVRRTVIEVTRPAVFRELLALQTFCSGLGGRWAERRVSIVGDEGAGIEAVSLWVHVDLPTGRPMPLDRRFEATYRAAAGDREVTARLQHPTAPPPDADSRPWLVRAVDLDLLAHVNNAAGWALVEQALVDHGWTDRGRRTPLRAELEYRDAIEADADLELLTVSEPGRLQLWARDRHRGVVHLTGSVRHLPG